MKPRRTSVILLLLFLFCLLFQGWLWQWSLKDSVWLQRRAPEATLRVGVAEGSIFVLHLAGDPAAKGLGKFERANFPWATFFRNPPKLPPAWRSGSIMGPGSEGKRLALWVLMLAECAIFLPFMAWRRLGRSRSDLH